MTPLTKIGKRLDNIVRYVLDNHPQDKWILSNIVPTLLNSNFFTSLPDCFAILLNYFYTLYINKLTPPFKKNYKNVERG